MKTRPYPTPSTKIDLKWIKDLNRNLKPLSSKENTGGKQPDIGLGDDTLHLTPKAKITKAKINRWDYVKLESFCTSKETNKMKGNLLNERKSLQIMYLTRG